MPDRDDPATPPPPVTRAHVARGLGTTVLARMGALIELVTQPLYVLMFGLAGYGVYAVLWAAINLAENILDCGMTSALQRSVPQAASESGTLAALATALLWGVGPCIAVAAGASLAAPWLATLVNAAPADAPLLTGAIRLFAWALPLWAFVEIATSALRAKALFGPEIRLRIFWEQIIRLIIAAVLWLAGWGLMALIVAHFISLALTALLAVRLLARHFPLSSWRQIDWSDPAVRATTAAGWSALPVNIAARLFSDAPPLVLNAMLPGAAGASAAGLIVAVRKLSSVVQLVRTAFAYVLAPLASQAARHDLSHARELYAFAVRVASAVALPLAAALAAGHAPLLGLFGRGADAASGALILLLLARGIESVFGVALPVQQVVGQYRGPVIASIGGVAVAGALAWLLVPGAPLEGMALAVGAGLIVTAVVPLIQLWRDDGIQPFDASYPGALAATLMIAGGAAVLVLLASALPDALALPFTMIAALAAIWGSCRFALSHEDRSALGSVGRRLRLV